MVSHLFYYQLALLAIIWLFIMLPLSWPGRSAPPATSPIKPKRKRSTEPKAFEGLTHKPHCALCDQETGETHPPSPVRPDPMPPTNRRPRTVDTSMHFCPHDGCRYRGWLELHNLRANGHPNGAPWRQFQCLSCLGYFPEHHGTIFHGKQAAVELIVRVLACLAEGLGIRATARVFEVAPHTVLHWLVEAAEQLRAFSAYFFCDLHVKQVQLDELYAVLRGVINGEISEDDAIKRLERSRHWVWTVIDPESTLLLATDIGPRTMAMAQRVVHQVTQALAPGCVPLFLTDGFKEYRTAILAQQFPLMAQSPQTSAARRAFGAVRLSISLWYRCFCRHRESLVSWKKTWGRARGALTPRRGHLVRDWRGKGTGKLESRGIDRKDGGGTLQAVEQGFEQLTHRWQGVGVKQRAHALP